MGNTFAPKGLSIGSLTSQTRSPTCNAPMVGPAEGLAQVDLAAVKTHANVVFKRADKSPRPVM